MIQDRTVTVRGVGSTSVSPDRVVLDLAVVEKDMVYAEATERAAKRVHALSVSVVEAGLEAKELKTKAFDVKTNYRTESTRLSGGTQDRRKVFDGYECTYALKLEFPFDKQLLARVLNTLAASAAEASIDLSFTVSDPAAVRNEILRLAAINAREKAEALTGALGAKLGALLSIDYNWTDVVFRSPMAFGRVSECMSEMAIGEMEPDDITASDSATFVWELL